MQWTRTETVGLAKSSCAHCLGYGLRPIRHGREVPCGCVFRAIFRACYARFRQSVTKERHLSAVTLEYCRGRDRHRSYGRKTEEFIADFCLVADRSLDAEDKRLFHHHYLLGADWKLCCRFLNMERGNFFHSLYRIERRLGRIFCELQPYPLFPLDEYFGGTMRKEAVRAAVASLPPMPRTRLRVPLARSA